MTAKILKMRSKRYDTVTAILQLALELPLGLSDTTRDELATALDRYAPPERFWTYTMLNPDQLRLVLKKINACPHPGLTLRVWTAAVTHIRMETGEIMASRHRLANDADTSAQEVSRALSRLTDMGILLRLKPGRYGLNPHVGWAGSLAQREAAAKGVPQLRLID